MKKSLLNLKICKANLDSSIGKYILFLFLYFFIFNNLQAQVKFQCGQYVTRQVSTGGNNYKSVISLLFDNNGTVGLTPVCENTSYLWNGAVFYDGYIYSWRQYSGVTQSGNGTSTLCRINGDCSVTEYTTNVPVGTYNNAYVDNSGNFYLANATTTSNVTTFTIYKINLTTLTGGTNTASIITVTAAPSTPAFTSSSAGIGDMYFDGTNAYIWLNGGPGSGAGNQGLARIDYTNATTGTYTRIGTGNRVSGSLFKNSNDPTFLYGYGSASGSASPQDRIIKVAIATGIASDVLVTADPAFHVLQSDGAGCSSSTFEIPNPIANPNQVCKTRGTNVAGSTVTFNGAGGNPANVTVNDQAFGFIGNTPNPSIIDVGTVEFTGPGVLSNSNKTMTIAGEGVWTVDASGVVVFTPESGFAVSGGNPAAAIYKVKDSNGKVSNSTTITITYAGPPVFTNCPAPEDLGCNPTGLPNPLTLTVTGGTVTNNSLGPVTNVGLCGRTQTRTYTATDACDGTATCEQVFTWTVDTTPPTASNPADINLMCNESIPNPDINVVNDEADACGTPIVTWVNDGTPTMAGCIETTMRTYLVSDGCGNTKEVIQKIVRTVDLVNPVITLTDLGTVPCNPTAEQISAAFGTASVQDNCSTGLTATGTETTETGSGCDFSVTKNWTVTDACGNTGTASQTLNFKRDLVNPVITLTDLGTVPCNPTAEQISAAFGTASVEDNCSTGLTATGTETTETGSGCDFSVTKNWTVTDACGNTGTASQTLNFKRDLVNPVITLTDLGTVPCNPTAEQISAAFGTASVEDNCSTGLTATGTETTETGSGCDFSVTKNWTVTDACGNTGTASQTLNFKRDLVNPVITLTDLGIVPCNPTAEQISAAFGTASVQDNCSTGLTATGTETAETGSGCDFSVTKNWTVTDACGNTGTASQTLNFKRDLVNPVITLTDLGTVPCNPTAEQISAAFGTASVQDNCSTGLTATGTETTETGSGCDFSVTKNWTVTDACGNTGTASQTLNFKRDLVNPVITLTDLGTVPCNPTAEQISAAFGTASVQDNCSTGLTATGTETTETGSGCDFSVTKNWTVTDACGNTGTASQTLNFKRDLVNPVITLTDLGTVPCNPTAEQISAAFGTASVQDNCSTGLTATGTETTETGSGCDFSVTKNWTVTDACGNTGTASQTLNFKRDLVNPVITLTDLGTVPCNPTAEQISAAFGTASVQDNCSTGLTATGTETTETGSGCDFSVTKNWTVTDACGNTGTASQTLNFKRDLVKPAITCDSYEVIENPLNQNCTFDKVLKPTVSDNCTATNEIVVTYSLSGATTVIETALTSNPVTFNKGITTVTYTATDLCGNTSTCSFLVTVRCESNIVCTFWSEDYAGENWNPTCSEFGPVAIQNAMLSALGGNPFTFGSATNGFTLTPADITSNTINTLLANGIVPLPGTSEPLGAGVGTSASAPNVPLVSGVINNPLLIRTIALYFNLQNSIALDNIEITNNMWTQLVDCGTGVPFGPNILTQIPAPVVSYLFNGANGYPRNVKGLLDLANDVLGGTTVLPAPTTFIPSLDELKTAVERINNAFRNCAVLVAPNVNATGNLFFDLDGMNDGIIDGDPGAILNGSPTGQAGVQLYLTLIEGDAKDVNGNNTGAILKVAPITNVGTYLFDPVVAGTYTINVGYDPLGSRKPSLPNNLTFNGEGGRLSTLADVGNVVVPGGNIVTAAGFAVGDGNPNGRIELIATTTSVTYVNGARAMAPMADLTDINFAIGNGPLPVRLISFTGKSTDKGNELSWKTSQEQNFSHYEIERSADSKSFKNIGKVLGAGNSKENLNYSFIDNSTSHGVVPGASSTNQSFFEGDAYYRLKMIDLDGSYEYSKIIFIKNDVSAIEVGNFYPNPAFGNEVSIKIKTPERNSMTITSYDLSGKMINVETKMLEKGENNLKLNINRIQSKNTIFRFELGSNVIYRKLNN